MTQTELFELMKSFEKSDIHELSYSQGDTKIKLKKRPLAPAMQVVAPAVPTELSQAQPQVSTAPQAPKGTQIKAPLVGTFYAAPSPESPTFVSVGDKVKKGQTLCIVEAMKMLNELPAPYDCIIEEVLVQNETLVAYDEPLFVVTEL